MHSELIFRNGRIHMTFPMVMKKKANATAPCGLLD